VVKLGAAAIISANDTRLIELEHTATGINSDGHWGFARLCLSVLNARGDLAPGCDLSDSFARVMSALSLLAVST